MQVLIPNNKALLDILAAATAARAATPATGKRPYGALACRALWRPSLRLLMLDSFRVKDPQGP